MQRWLSSHLLLHLFFLVYVLGGEAPSKPNPVLVLGSGGFLGRVLVSHLLHNNYPVKEVRGRSHVDLRDPAALSAYASTHGPFSFIFFLACEVGGSRFLEDPGSQKDILRHNVQMYEAVFPWAAATGTPLLFTSSSMRHMPSGAYGTVKALGEEYLAALLPPSLGRSVRLYNIYGREALSRRSHVLSDWAAQCVREGSIASLTAAPERRQFLHVHDAAAALVAIMQHWDAAFDSSTSSGWWGDSREGEGEGGSHGGSSGTSNATLAAGVGEVVDPTLTRRTLDVTSGVWHGLAELAARISTLAQAQGLGPCPLTVPSFSTSTSSSALLPRPEVQPQGGQYLHLLWQHWMPRSGYPYGVEGGLPTLATDADEAAAAAASVGGAASVSPVGEVEGSGGGGVGLGWITMDAGLTDLIRFHALSGSSTAGAVLECSAE